MTCLKLVGNQINGEKNSISFPFNLFTECLVHYGTVWWAALMQVFESFKGFDTWFLFRYTIFKCNVWTFGSGFHWLLIVSITIVLPYFCSA